MAEKKKGIDLPQTKGKFQVRGKVVGTQKDNFYVEKLTKTSLRNLILIGLTSTQSL